MPETKRLITALQNCLSCGARYIELDGTTHSLRSELDNHRVEVTADTALLGILQWYGEIRERLLTEKATLSDDLHYLTTLKSRLSAAASPDEVLTVLWKASGARTRIVSQSGYCRVEIGVRNAYTLCAENTGPLLDESLIRQLLRSLQRSIDRATVALEICKEKLRNFEVPTTSIRLYVSSGS